MSVFIGDASPQSILCDDADPRSHLRAQRTEQPSLGGLLRLEVEAPVGDGSHSITQPFALSAFYGDLGVDVGILDAPLWIMPPPMPGGANGRLGFNGFSRDASGGVIAGVTVKLFLTSTDVKQCETVSNTDGFFVVSTAEAGGHYLLFYKAGTPDVSGTTVNTLAGA